MREALSIRVWMWREDWRIQRQRWAMALAWRLPRWLVAWAVVRCYSHATTGRWSGTHPDQLGYGELTRRWELPHE